MLARLSEHTKQLAKLTMLQDLVLSVRVASVS